jgi:pimeloyl-ACP methyl ester carboxylesterase
MQPRLLTLLVLLATLLGTGACGAQATPTPVPAPTAAPPQPTAAVEPTPSPEPTQEPAASGQPAVAWEEAPCPMDLPAGVEGEQITCGYVTVPEERALPGAAEIQLAVAVIHSTSDAPLPDPLFMLAGGPGESALTSFVQILVMPGMEIFWAKRDVVLVEQRGTRYSRPFLQCDEMSELRLDLLDENLGDEEEEARKLDAWAACHDRFVEEGINLGAYNSVENAADIVEIADALGYDQINIYGGSYGTLLAQHIMRDHPERVRSAILGAVSPLRHEPNLLYKAHSADRALRLLFTQCQADPACSEAYPDLEQVYFDLVDRLNEEPATLQIHDPATGEGYDMLLTGDRLVALTRDLLYVTAILPDLPAAIYDMAAGDFGLAALIQSQFMFNLNLADGMYNSVICTELADFTAADMADAGDLYPQVAEVVEDLIDEVMLQPCQVWGVEHLGDYVTESVAGDIPTLLLSGEFDPTVPPHLAEVAAEKLTNAYLYIFPGMGHSNLGSGECVTSMMVAFLDDPTQAPDAGCLEELTGLVFRVPAAEAELELEPYTNEALGIGGVAPRGWTEVRPGALARGSSAVDQTVLIYDGGPVSADDLLALIVQQFGLAETPESSGQREANGLVWTLYELEAQGYPVDFALAEHQGQALIILLISHADEHDTLYEAVFVPAVEALTLLE